MENLLEFLIRSGIILTFLYGIYWLFLRKKPHSIINRFYLITALFLSFLLPLLPITFSGGKMPGAIYSLEPVLITPQEFASGLQESVMPLYIVGFLYLAGSCIFLARLTYQLFKTTLLIRRYGKIRVGDTSVVITDQQNAPFSIFNLIVVSRETFESPGLQQIIEHENAHIKQYHTLDLFLVEFLVLFHWFNPVIWLYKRSFRSLHEYLADRSVLDQGSDLLDYQQLLLTQTFGVQFNSVSNFFNSNQIKNRFIMMTKEKNNRISNSTLFVVFPITLFFTFILSVSFTNPMVSEKPAMSSTELIHSPIDTPQDDPVFTKVDQMPVFKGGHDAMVNYLIKNIRYPEEASKNNVEGKVFTTFVIEKDGRVNNARVLKSVDKLLDEEALRVVKAMPAWVPGKNNGKPVRVQFNLPIDFKLDGDKKSKKETPGDNTRKGVKQYQKIKQDQKSDGIQ